MRSIIRLTPLALALALVIHTGAASAILSQEPMGRSPGGVTLAEAVSAALRQNPDVLIAQAATDSARAERHIARALPNPTLSAVPNTPFQYAASIPLDMTPSRLYRTRAAGLGVDASKADHGDVVRQTTLAVARAFFDLLLSERTRDLAAERRDAVRQLLAADSARYHSGEIPFHNLARSEVEMARADADLARAEVAIQAGRIALQSLMGRARPDTAFTVAGSLDYRAVNLQTDSLLAVAFARRPDLNATVQRVQQSRSIQQTTAAMLFPTPVLSYVRQFNGRFDNGHYFALGLSFDLPSLDLYSGQRARAAAGLETAQLARRRVEVQIERDVTSAVSDFNIQRSLIERYQAGLLSRVDESVKAVRYAYTRGASSLLDVLDAVRSQQDVRVDYYSALHDYWLSIYSLNAAVGADVVHIEP